MNPPLQSPSPPAKSRRSQHVALALLGTMGVVGGVVIWHSLPRARPDPFAPVEQPEAPVTPVSADRTYQNNEFTPGAGYYHAPQHAWFPLPFNHHDPSRGYFAGGLWQAAPLLAGLLSSRPSAPAVTSALAAQQTHTQAQRARAGTAGFAPRPAAAPSSAPSQPAIQRGGFGSSGKGTSGAGT